MKKIFILLLFIGALSANHFSQSSNKEKTPKGYDAKLAKKLGADEMGMKVYVFAMLKRGKVKFEDSVRQELINGHLKNIGQLSKEGKLLLAGPFMDDQDWRGIYIFNVSTLADAQKLVETDPAIKAGVFEVEMHPWYGSATLLEIPKMHSKIQKKTF